MGCCVLEFGEGEVGAYGRGFEDMKGVKVDLFFFLNVRGRREGGLRLIKSFFIFLEKGRGGGGKQKTYLCKSTSQKRANEKLEPL